MRVGIISVFTDYHRRGRHHRGALQPQIGPLIAALLPHDAQLDIVNDAWDDPHWDRDYDLLFVSCLHSDFDRARQISHYWRRRGAKTVLGGPMASQFPQLCAPYFDSIAIGDPEPVVPAIVRDFGANALRPLYRAQAYRGDTVPLPRLDLVADRQLLPFSFEVTRGCPYACDFCVLTGLGTRYHTRSVEAVAAQLESAKRMLAPLAPWHRRRLTIFYDNNLGGNPTYLRELCAAIEPLDLRWGCCVTFNVVRDEATVARMAAAGCCCVYVGIETFNPAALADMRKHQNVLAETRRVVDLCRRHGILLTAGLMLSPRHDPTDYIDAIPAYLKAAGIHVPTYICFETPFPGTPHFARLAASHPAPLMPGTLLSDLDGYTVATRPRYASPTAFVEAYKRVHREVYGWPNRIAKLADDLPRLAIARSPGAIVVDCAEVLFDAQPLPADRSFLAGADKVRPEHVPLTAADFADEAERAVIMDSWAVADEEGRPLSQWLGSRRVYEAKGRVAPVAASEPLVPRATHNVAAAAG